MHWSVGLLGDPYDLQELARVFVNHDPIVRQREDGEFVVESVELDEAANVNEVCDKAEPLLALLNGAMKADDFAFRPVGLSNKAWDESGAQHNRALAGSATTRAKARIVAAGAVDGESSPPTPDPALQIFALRESEANAPDVLRLIATRDLDWATLYKVLEIIHNDVGGDKAIADLGWASRKRLGVFTTSANHPEASGDDARHARMKGTPTDTMTLPEGRAFLQSLVQAWLQWLIAGRPPPT